MRYKDRVKFSDYTITSTEYDFIVENTEIGSTVLEFGPGSTTWAFLENDCRISTYECKEKWFKIYKETFSNFPVQVHLVPPNIPMTINGSFDIGMIDAPTGAYYYKYSRINSTLLATLCCRRIFMHDGARANEKRTIEVLHDLCWEVVKQTKDGNLVILENNRKYQLLPRNKRFKG
jgi:hypothetical protein